MTANGGGGGVHTTRGRHESAERCASDLPHTATVAASHGSRGLVPLPAPIARVATAPTWTTEGRSTKLREEVGRRRCLRRSTNGRPLSLRGSLIHEKLLCVILKGCVPKAKDEDCPPNDSWNSWQSSEATCTITHCPGRGRATLVDLSGPQPRHSRAPRAGCDCGGRAMEKEQPTAATFTVAAAAPVPLPTALVPVAMAPTGRRRTSAQTPKLDGCLRGQGSLHPSPLRRPDGGALLL